MNPIIAPETGTMDDCEINFAEICRCCKGTSPKMSSIFDTSHSTYHPIYEMLGSIASLNVQENDGLPSLICAACLKCIQDAYSFRQQLIHVDSELWQLLVRKKLQPIHTDRLPAVEDNLAPVNDTNEDIGNFLISLLGAETEPEPKDSTEVRKAYYCDQCDKSYSILKSLQIHLRDHHCLATVYIYKLCNASISNKPHLKQHLYVHLKEKPFICGQCKLGFNRLDSLDKHQVVCDGDSPLSCDVCNCEFTSQTALELHKSKHSSSDMNLVLTLEDLENPMEYFQQFGSNDDVGMVDIADMSGVQLVELPGVLDKQKVYSCLICGVKFKHFHLIKQHLNSHCTTKPFSCSKCNCCFGCKEAIMCNKKFQSEDSCRSHKTRQNHLQSGGVKQINIALQDFEANLEKYFAVNYNDVEIASLPSDEDDDSHIQDSNSLDITMMAKDEEAEVGDPSDLARTHSSNLEAIKRGARHFTCKLCDFTCNHLYYIKHHLRTHLKDKTFSCRKCKQVFAQRDRTAKHFRECDVCHCSLQTEQKLEDHRNASINIEALMSEDSQNSTKLLKYYSVSEDANADQAQTEGGLLEQSEHLKATENVLVEIKVEELPSDQDNADAHSHNANGDSDSDYDPTERKTSKRSKVAIRRSRRSAKIQRKLKMRAKIVTTAKIKTADKEEEPVGMQFTCRFCSKSFKKLTHLEAHGREWHQHDHVLKCAQCSATFARAYALNRHMRTHAKDPQDEAEVEQQQAERSKCAKRHECDQCLRHFASSQALRHHRKQHDAGDACVCPKCGKPFLTKSHLNEHMKFHGETRKFLCSECGQGFVRNDYLIIHMRRHRGEKPFECRFCGKGFPRVTDLKVHERYHTGEKTHLCVVCGRGFNRAYNLTVHMRTHTGEKPYKCSYCDSAFAQSNDLKSHIRRHTGERFQCDLCPMNFLMGYELIHHKRKVHGMNIVGNVRRITANVHSGQAPETVQLPRPVLPAAPPTTLNQPASDDAPSNS